jgi:putative transposase
MFKGRHFDRSIILLCIRWYLAYNLSLRNLEEMMAESGIAVDHSASLGCSLLLRVAGAVQSPQASRHRQVARGRDYIKVRGRWMYVYRAIGSNGDTVEFGSASGAIWLRPSAFCARHSSGTADLSGSSSTAARPTGRHASLQYGKPTPGSVEGQTEADPDPAKSLSESSYRTGSSRHQTAGSTDARVQVDGVRSDNSGRDRDDPHDAQRTGEVCPQSAAFAR